MGNIVEIPTELPVTSTPEFKRPADLPFTCSDDDLLLAVQGYLAGDKIEDVASLLKIGKFHVKHWLTSRGWKYLEDCVREDVRKIGLSNAQRLANRCFAQIEERLEKGDPIVSLDGEVVAYKPVKVKDLAQMAALLYDKMHDIEDRTGKKKEEEHLTLKELAESLKNYVQVKREQARDITSTAVELPS